MPHDIQIRVHPHGIHSELDITVSFPDEWGDALIGALKAASCRDDPEVLSLLKRLIIMSGTQAQTFDAAMADISARLDKLSTDLAADLAGITSGPLNPTQQASVDAIKAKIDTLDATVLPPPPPPPAA